MYDAAIKKIHINFGLINRSILFKIWEVMIPFYSAKLNPCQAPDVVLCSVLGTAF